MLLPAKMNSWPTGRDINYSDLSNYNWGPIGGGKTFAAYYFKNINWFPDSDRSVINVYVRTPKEGGNAFTQLFKDFIDNYSLSAIKREIKNISNQIGEEALENLLRSSNISEEYSKAIMNLGKDDDRTSRIMTGFVFGTATAAEIKSVNLYRPLKTEPDFVKFLAGIIIVLTCSPTASTRLFFWIDEMEDMVYFNSKQFHQFSQSIRDLVDTINEKFTLFMNFTLSEGEEDTVKTLLGEALWSRKNYDIRFKDFKVVDGIDYCKDLIHHYQIDTSIEYFPFELPAIELVLKTLPTALLTPREINKKLSSLLLFSLQNDKKIISTQVVAEHERSLIIE
jgi:hypothetical protein